MESATSVSSRSTAQAARAGRSKPLAEGAALARARARKRTKRVNAASGRIIGRGGAGAELSGRQRHDPIETAGRGAPRARVTATSLVDGEARVVASPRSAKLIPMARPRRPPPDKTKKESAAPWPPAQA